MNYKSDWYNEIKDSLVLIDEGWYMGLWNERRKRNNPYKGNIFIHTDCPNPTSAAKGGIKWGMGQKFNINNKIAPIIVCIGCRSIVSEESSNAIFFKYKMDKINI